MRTIVINNEKGGVGKTMIATHLAWHLVERGHRVLFVDLDLQGNASSALDRTTVCEHDLHAIRGADAADLFLSADDLTIPAHAFVLLAASEALNRIDREIDSSVPRFVTAMTSVAPGFDMCVIDTPPSWGVRNFAALLVADHLLVPLQLEHFAIDGLNGLLRSVAAVDRARDHPVHLLGLVPSLFQSHSTLQKRNLHELIARLGGADLLLPAVLTVRQGYAEAMVEGRPVWRSRKSAAIEAGREIRSFFDLLLARMLAHGA